MADKKYIVNGTVLTKAYDDGEDFFEVPKSVVKIETNAFKGCKNLEEINLKYIYEFGNGALAESGIRAVELHAPVISDMLFQGCIALSEIEFFGTREIGVSAFERTGAPAEIALPETLVKIGNFAFITSGIRRVHLPRKVASIGKGAFAGCGPVYVYSKTSAENYWGTAIHINKAFVEILNENDDTHEEFFFYPEIFQSIGGCFQNGKFDIVAFDRAVFHLKDISSDEIRNRMYAMLVRLPGIYKLHNSEFYVCYSAFIDYFKAHKPRSAMAVLVFDKERFLGFLELAIDENTFPELLDYSIKKGDHEVTAAILKYKNEHFPNLTDNFDLE